MWHPEQAGLAEYAMDKKQESLDVPCCKTKLAGLRGLICPRILATQESYLPYDLVSKRSKYIMYSDLYKQLKF